MIIDPAAGEVLVAKVVSSLIVIMAAILGVWHRFYRTRTGVSQEKGVRTRFEDAIHDAKEARKEVHDVNNVLMAMQRDLGRFEAENKACNRRSRVQAVRIGRLERQNTVQAEQIMQLTKALKGRFNPSDSDIR